MTAKNRLLSIKKQIETERKVFVSDLSEKYGVTEETIRRDLCKLEEEGVLNRTFGGAVLAADHPKDGVHYYKRKEIHAAEKRKIASAFQKILSAKRTIAADSSTTVREVVEMLDVLEEVTILTNSIALCCDVKNIHINMTCIGGSFDKSNLSLLGQLAIENIKRYHVDIALISCRGLSMENGAMDSRESEVQIKQAMMDQALEIALFADHTKFDRPGFVHLSAWDRIDYLVTDLKPNQQWLTFCEEKGISLIYGEES